MTLGCQWGEAQAGERTRPLWLWTSCLRLNLFSLFSTGTCDQVACHQMTETSP